MFKHTRKVTRVVTRTLAAASIAVVPLLLTNACSGEKEHTVVTVGENGRLQLNLTGISNTNLVYRLRNATFSIYGQSTGFYVDVNTETQPDSSSLLVELPADTYQVFLQDGYYLELLSSVPLTARRSTDARKAAGEGGGKLTGRALAAAFAADAGVPPDEPPPPPEDPPLEPPPPVEPPPIEPPIEVPGGTVVDATLISSNPAVVAIQPNVVSPVNFVFQVAGGTVETGNGVLDIGITVLDEGQVCSPDAFEPNDDISTPTPIAPTLQLSATLCDVFDIDNYIFQPPVAAGESFSVTVGFQHALGDIDAVLIEAATGNVVSASTGVSDNEFLVTASSGGDYILQVYLFSDDPNGNGNTYTVDIEASTGGGGGENSCCEASALPGCNDPEVLSCVCAVDSFCCDVQFDSLCVSEALQCGTSCSNEGAESDCCTSSDAPGCTDQTVHDCVCATDFACCSSGFDEVCVAQAIAECGAQCTLPAPVSDCCSASSVPGCTVPEVQACVCDIDPFCCAGGFDENCAALAEQQCGAECQF